MKRRAIIKPGHLTRQDWAKRISSQWKDACVATVSLFPGAGRLAEIFLGNGRASSSTSSTPDEVLL